ncbi:hypothetical protein GGI14_003931 [Coemansia sp. S680]|nr:hypothetical protein GGI14_003931 [Coemansia sp. S680]
MFQLLPPHVVKLIVHCVADSSHWLYNCVTTESDKYKVPQMPLLWSESDNVYPPDTMDHITAFAQRVKMMVPEVREINVLFSEQVKYLLESGNVHILDLVRRLFWGQTLSRNTKSQRADSW